MAVDSKRGLFIIDPRFSDCTIGAGAADCVCVFEVNNGSFSTELKLFVDWLERPNNVVDVDVAVESYKAYCPKTRTYVDPYEKPSDRPQSEAYCLVDRIGLAAGPEEVLEDFFVWAEGRPTRWVIYDFLMIVSTTKGMRELLIAEHGLNDYGSSDDPVDLFDWKWIHQGRPDEEPDYDDPELAYLMPPPPGAMEPGPVPREVCEACKGTGQELSPYGTGFGIGCSYCGGDGYR